MLSVFHRNHTLNLLAVLLLFNPGTPIPAVYERLSNIFYGTNFTVLTGNFPFCFFNFKLNNMNGWKSFGKIDHQELFEPV